VKTQIKDKDWSLSITDLGFVSALPDEQLAGSEQVQGGLLSFNGLLAQLDVNQAKREFFPGVGQGIGTAGEILPLQFSLGDPLRQQGSTTSSITQSQNQLSQSFEREKRKKKGLH
jgi:hypothetical protein